MSLIDDLNDAMDAALQKAPRPETMAPEVYARHVLDA